MQLAVVVLEALLHLNVDPGRLLARAPVLGGDDEANLAGGVRGDGGVGVLGCDGC